MQIVKRKLSDLWVVGKELVLDDGGGSVVVWVQKMNSAESQESSRRCDAARARVLAARRDPEGSDWQAVHNSVLDYGRDDFDKVLEFLAGQERNRCWRSREAVISNSDEWSKDNYIQGLRDAWADTLDRRSVTEPQDPEVVRVKAELARFVAQVNEAVDDDLAALRASWEQRPESEMEDEMTEKLLVMDANQAWVTELHHCQLLFGIRDPEDHKQHYFAERDEVDQLSTEVFNRLHLVYEGLEVDAIEGKSSPAPTPSSPSSEEPGEAATEAPSGLVGASQ